MAFTGERSSCVTFARNCDFSSLTFSSSRARASATSFGEGERFVEPRPRRNDERVAVGQLVDRLASVHLPAEPPEDGEEELLPRDEAERTLALHDRDRVERRLFEELVRERRDAGARRARSGRPDGLTNRNELAALRGDHGPRRYEAAPHVRMRQVRRRRKESVTCRSPWGRRPMESQPPATSSRTASMRASVWYGFIRKRLRAIFRSSERSVSATWPLEKTTGSG